MQALRILLQAGLLLTAAVPVAAAAQQLPETSRSERQYNSINRSLEQQGRGLGASQQNQFEVNQLRGDVQRSNQFPTLTGPRGCVPGSAGC